jgi:hypothetical protein
MRRDSAVEAERTDWRLYAFRDRLALSPRLWGESRSEGFPFSSPEDLKACMMFASRRIDHPVLTV